jgi:hypothetical protein
VKVQGGGSFGRNSALDVGLDKGTKAYCQGKNRVFRKFILTLRGLIVVATRTPLIAEPRP